MEEHKSISGYFDHAFGDKESPKCFTQWMNHEVRCEHVSFCEEKFIEFVQFVDASFPADPHVYLDCTMPFTDYPLTHFIYGLTQDLCHSRRSQQVWWYLPSPMAALV